MTLLAPRTADEWDNSPCLVCFEPRVIYINGLPVHHNFPERGIIDHKFSDPRRFGIKWDTPTKEHSMTDILLEALLNGVVGTVGATVALIVLGIVRSR